MSRKITELDEAHFFFQNDPKLVVILLAHRCMTFSAETSFGTEHNFDFDKLVFMALSLMWL